MDSLLLNFLAHYLKESIERDRLLLDAFRLGSSSYIAATAQDGLAIYSFAFHVDSYRGLNINKMSTSSLEGVV